MHPIIALLAHNFLLASQVICLLRARIITVRQRIFWSIHVSCEMGLPQVRCYSTQLCLWSPSLLTVHQVLGCVLMEDTPIGQFDKCNKFQPKLELGKQTAPSFNYSLCVPDMLTIQLFYHLCFKLISSSVSPELLHWLACSPSNLHIYCEQGYIPEECNAIFLYYVASVLNIEFGFRCVLDR